MAFEIMGKIANTDSSSGLVDDYDLIGGYRVVKTRSELDTLKTEELDILDFLGTECRLKKGCLVYCVEEEKTYRWDGENFKEEIIQASGGDGGSGGSDYSGGFKVAVNVTEYEEIRANARNSTIDLPDGFTVYVTETNLTYRWNLERRDNNAEKDFTCVTPNIERGSGKGATQQLADKVADGFEFAEYNEDGTFKLNEDGTPKYKNPNAMDKDADLKALVFTRGKIPYGARGDYSSAFGGKSSAQGKRSHAEGTTTIAKGNYSHAEGDNSVTLGADSHAEGYATTAHGTGSHAEGRLTLASGDYSHAEGVETKTAEGADGAHAEGYKSEANGYASHAEGNAKALGDYSHAEGDSKANGPYSHAEGSSNANADFSHAEGGDSSANGYASHAEGQSHAYGEYSHAEGQSYAYGDYSHSEGNNCAANGDHSHAGGIDSVAESWGSFAHGQGVISAGTAKTAVGRYNSPDGDALFEVGNGTADDDRKTAFKVMLDGRAKVQAAPVDPDDVLRKGDLQTMTHAATADKAESVNDIVFLKNSDGSRVTYEVFWNRGIYFAPDQYMDKGAYRYFAPLDISENPNVNYSELELGYKYLFSHPTYGMEILVADYHPDSTLPIIFLRGRSDGAYAKFYNNVFRGLWDMPIVEEVSIYHAKNADLANEAHGLALRQEHVFTQRGVSGENIIHCALDEGIYLCYLTTSFNLARINLGVFIAGSYDYSGGLIPIRNSNGAHDYFYEAWSSDSGIFVRKVNKSYEVENGWVTNDDVLTCIKIGTVG